MYTLDGWEGSSRLPKPVGRANCYAAGIFGPSTANPSRVLFLLLLFYVGLQLPFLLQEWEDQLPIHRETGL
jgi:hypothetical protein